MASSEFLVWGNNQGNLLVKSSIKSFPNPTRLDIGFQIVSLCASEKHVSFLTKDGSVYSYGINLDGRLGVSTKAVDKVGYDAPVKVPLKDKVIRIQSGFSHMCALTDKGELYAWGLGDYGALGTGQFKSRSIPTKVQLPKDALLNLRQISCGAMHTAFLTDLGEVYTCGSNQYGQLGVNKPEKVSTPLPISFHQHVQQISCGVFYTLLLTKEGRVFGMGNNKYGQLGIGHKVNECHPTMLRDLEGIVKVSAGYHSGAIDLSGNLYIWGSGSFGEYVRPQKYVLSVPIRDLAIRGFFGLAIGHNSREQNRVYTWGNNTFGELGVGNYDAAKEPLQVENLRGRQIGKIVLGVNFAMVLLMGSSRSIQPMTQWTSQQFGKLVNEQKNRDLDRYARQTEKKSVIGFQQGYLNSHLKSANEHLIREYEREKIINRSNEKEMNARYNKSQTRRQSSPIPQFTYRDQPSASRDYQKLFLTLSQDYQKLVAKYKTLQKQLQSTTPQYPTYRGSETHRNTQMNINSDSTLQNGALKEQISKVNYEFISLRDELRTKNRIIQEQRYQMERIKSGKSSHTQPLPQQLQIEYNKLLNQKEQVINKMTVSLNKLQEENTILLAKLETEKGDLSYRLDNERDKTSKIIKEHQLLIDELQAELKKSEDKYICIREQNDILKNKFVKMEESWKQIEAYRIRMEEESETQRLKKQKYQSVIKDAQIQKSIITDRIEQLEMELNYEKQFNKKYQLTMAEVNDLKQQLHKQLNVQMDINQEQQAKIENLKADVEKFKKYKKELDEKNIIIEQHNSKFENYKRKIEDVMAQKEDKIADLQELMESKANDYENKLRQKDDLVEEQYRENNRLQKEISKQKQTISTLKQQVSLQEDQIDNLSQQKVSNQKKITYLTSELNKQVNERQQILADLGEAKRQLVKAKIAYGEIQTKYTFEKEEKQKYIRANENKDAEIKKLNEELGKVNEKCSNLEKENSMYRRQIDEANIRIEQLQKVNQNLTDANQQFAEAEKEFNEKIGSLENRVYELEDQNKSYTPRYEALLLRNKQLDQRNLQLSEMINKAIEIQAENYKSTILKEVETNTEKFIDQVRQEQEWKSRGRRDKLEFKQSPREDENNFKSPPVSNIKDEPYTREMKQRMTAHKRKVSESANKLASLLQIDESLRGERRNLGLDSRRTDDLEKINSHIDSFNTQKEEFMSKIQSFAQKLKIL